MLTNQAQKQFLIEKINPILEKLIVELLINKPGNVVDYMIQWLQTQGKNLEQQFNISPKRKKSDVQSDEGSEKEEDDEEEFDEQFELDKLMAKNKDKFQRNSVSAEVFGKFNLKGNFKPKIVQKDEDQIKRIKDRLSKAFMFSALDDQELNIVINAMEEKKFQIGEVVIKQGADGDNLYVIDQGELDCFKSFTKEEEPKLIVSIYQTNNQKRYQPGESFGELALLYNAPRAATVIANEDTILFSLDRQTFNNIVKDAASKKRQQYEEFLQRIELLQDIDPYERIQIADALKSKKYKKGEYIVRQGERGDTFYFLEQGECVATKKGQDNQPPTIVFNYKSGDYFGELAILRNVPRAASIVAQNDVTVVYLDRSTFKRLIGPVENILQRNFQRYEKFMT